MGASVAIHFDDLCGEEPLFVGCVVAYDDGGFCTLFHHNEYAAVHHGGGCTTKSVVHHNGVCHLLILGHMD